VVALAAQWWPGWHWAIEPLLLTALISPAMLAWEFARRWLYKIDRADMVALSATIYLLLLVVVAWLASRGLPSATTGAFAWIAGSVAALAVALPGLSPQRLDRIGAARMIRTHGRESAWLAATNLPYSVYSSASIVVLIGAAIGPVAAALFTAARTLTNPAISIVSAIDSIDKPRAARALATDGIAGLKSIVRRSRISIAIATGVYLGFVALFATPLIALAFHGQYAGSEENVRLLAIGFFLFGLNLPSETMLIVLRAGRTMLAIRTITALATIAALALAAPYGIHGMAIAFAATQAANMLLLRLAEMRVARAAS
jgi:O-antigen/teichoic acid export membrane protein